MKRQIVIWGAGNQGREAYYNLKRNYEIVGFADSDNEKIGKEIVDGKKVLGHYHNFFIVIACGKWMEVSKELQRDGLSLSQDFIPYCMLLMKNVYLNNLLDCFDKRSICKYFNKVKNNKKIALIYGNCQVEIIANMLEYNKHFEKQYLLLRVPPVHLYQDEEQIDKVFYINEIMQLIDLFIFQNVSNHNRYNPKLGTDNILKMFSKNCRKLPIHNIYFDGYFIQYGDDENKYLKNMDKKDFPYTDSIIATFIDRGKSVNEILNLVFDEKLMTEVQIKMKCKNSLKNLKDREKWVEVPIVDYIEENYCNEQLFYTHNHPKNIVIYEYVRRILKALQIDEVDDFTEEELNMEFGTLRINNFPIFPCVIKALGLKKYESKVRISHISSKLIGVGEYIKEYIYRCYGME